MKILVCVPQLAQAHRGNNVAAARLVSGFEEQGHRTRRLACADSMDADAARAVAAAFAPDILLVLHAWRCAAVVHALRDSFRGPIVVSLRGTDAYQMLDDPLRGPTVLEVLEKCDAITVFHQSMLEQLALQSSQLGEKALVIPNGLALSRSEVDYRAELDVPPEAFAFVNVGGVREVKGQLILLERLSQLRTRFPTVHFLHAGPAVESDIAERFRVFEKANPWVHHRDEVLHAEIDSFLRAGSVYTSASRSEGMPHAVREAMAAGLPALLSDIPGHRSLAEDGSEALFFRNADDFERSAARLIEDAVLRRLLGTGACKRIARDLEGQDEIGSHLALFRSLLDSRAAAGWIHNILRREHHTPHGTIVEYGPEPLLADHATRFALAHLEVKRGSVVAEPGCGTAALSLFAARAGAGRVVGTDTDPEAVRAARFNVESNGLTNVDIREGSLLEPVDGPLDLVMALLPHKPGPRRFNPHYDGGDDGTRWLRQVIAQGADRLRAGGRLLLYLNSIANPSRVLAAFRESFDVSLLGEKKRYFTRKEFDGLTPGMSDHLWAQRDRGQAEFHEEGDEFFFWARIYEGVRR